MNRLIIIGNGFDIAHGLKTKYSDYINRYWSKVNGTNFKDKFIEFKGQNQWHFKNLSCLNDLLSEFKNSQGKLPTYRVKENYYSLLHHDLKILNIFFHLLNQKHSNADWVDIEMEYFKCLKKILLPLSQGIITDEMEESRLIKTKELNKEIKEIIIDFEKYMIEYVIPEIDPSYMIKMYPLFLNKKLTVSSYERFSDEFPKSYVEKHLNSQYIHNGLIQGNYNNFGSSLILNFNYTNTVAQYLKTDEVGSYTLVNIHGQFKNLANPINMGFGDEKDKFYSDIEDINDNEYLRFIKSFYYRNTNNYKKLFDFVETHPFQVQIMGHSCGLSDRTLLNAIFEHGNCESIKVFYHKFNEANSDGQLDNYEEITKNISRHFTQKTQMRSKIVNKEYCSPLPQKE